MQHSVNWVSVVFVVVSFLTGCASRPALQTADPMAAILGESAEQTNLPTLILEAYPRVGFSPLRVTVRAVLQNVPTNDPIFGCLWQSWSYGDGAVSSEKPGCDRPDYSVPSEYFKEHVYDEEGVYEVRFVLGKNQLLSNPVRIRVIRRN